MVAFGPALGPEIAVVINLREDAEPELELLVFGRESDAVLAVVEVGLKGNLPEAPVALQLRIRQLARAAAPCGRNLRRGSRRPLSPGPRSA